MNLEATSCVRSKAWESVLLCRGARQRYTIGVSLSGGFKGPLPMILSPGTNVSTAKTRIHLRPAVHGYNKATARTMRIIQLLHTGLPPNTPAY